MKKISLETLLLKESKVFLEKKHMAYWLVKSEPFKYSWEQFEKDKITFGTAFVITQPEITLRQ